MSSPKPPTAPSAMRGHIAYGLLGLPLAMAALPVYVQIPAYYSSQLGVALSQIGWILFSARLFDTFQDPLFGHVIDRLRASLSRWFVLAGLMLALAFAGLWLPPPSDMISTAFWLAAMLILAYSAHSMLNIAYLAWGARLPDAGQVNGANLLGASAWREAAGLVGVIAASVIPGLILAGDAHLMRTNMGWYSVGFAALLAIAILALLQIAPPWIGRRSQAGVSGSSVGESGTSWRAALQAMASNREFRRLLPPYFLNALSVSVPATLALFFISDRLQAGAWSGPFLACYFLAAAIGLPAWVALAKRIGALRSWRLGMVLAIVTFCGAALLGPGDVLPYFAVCIAAGLALSADLALPPVLLAQAIPQDEAAAGYFGIWTLLSKLALAVSGLALPLLAGLGYQPGTPGGAELSVVYAGLPCLLKLFAIAGLSRCFQHSPPSQARMHRRIS